MGLESKLVVKKLEFLLKDSGQVEAYLRMHGPNLDMKKVEAFKEQQERQNEASVTGDKNDPAYQIRVQCPVCGENDLLAYELKAKTLAVTYDKFLMPRYAPVKGFRALNYSLYAVTVCPQCLFASPDKKDFITFPVHTEGECESQLSVFTLEELRKKTGERKQTLPEVADAAQYFQHPRSVPAAMAAYRLALQRARVEIEMKIPLGCYKAGMYCLRIGLFLRDAGNSDRELARAAVKYLEASFSKAEMPSKDLECQLLYLIVALHLRLTSPIEAQSYLTALEKMGQLPELTGPESQEGRPVSFDRWLTEAKDLWADRENPKIWDH